MKEQNHLRVSAKPVSSAVLLLQVVASKKAERCVSHITGLQRAQTKLSGDTTIMPLPATSLPSTWRWKPPSVKSLQPVESIPFNLVMARQSGNIENFVGFGYCLSCSGLKSQTHRLVSVGPRGTQSSHHLNSAIHKFLEKETLTLVRSSQVESSVVGM